MKFKSTGFKHNPPFTVEIHDREDDAVAIVIEGFTFMILDNDGTFRLNRFHANSPMGLWVKRNNIPTAEAKTTSTFPMLTLVLR